MATSKITWENKEGIQNDGSIARKNKVMDDDMNEIKQVVNNNADELNIAQSNIEDLQSGQSTSNADITNIKNRISTLETDNKTNKSDISALKSDNTTNKENISTLQEQVSNKVDKVEGKGLSTNDYTTEEKQKLAGLKNYDDTEIKQNIADIKEEQETQNTNIENLQKNDETQDELIEKLQQENKNIKSALINVETEQAKSLHIEDASEVPAQLKILGNQEQKTREGYNLLNSSLFDLSEVSDLATFNQKDGTITFNGTANTDINIRSLRKQIIAGTGKENILIKIISGSLNGILRLVAQDINYGNIKYAQIGTSSFTNKLIENVEYNIFSITITSGTVMNNLKLGFMIVDDSNLDKEYEQYGAMPSVNYPSKVKCLGSNKNYFNKDTVTQDKYLTYQNQEVSNSAWTFSDYIECKPNEQWIISGYTAIGGAPGRCFYDKNKNYIPGGAHNNQESMMKFTIPDNCYYFRDSIAKADIDTVKIEQNNVATSYSSYGQGSTEISKINENLFDKNNYIKIYDGQVNSSGVINTSDARHKTLLIECRSNVELSAYIKNKNNSYSRLLSCFDEEPVVGETEATATSTSPNGLHITTTSNTKYLAIYLGATFDENWVSVQDIIDSVMLVKGNVSLTSKDYVEHKQSNYILNIQQEMLQGDYFVKEKDGWKEVHGWNKLTFIGNENFNKSGSATDEVFVATLDIDDGIEGKGYSNYFKYSSEIAIGNFLVYNNGSNIRFCVDGTEIATIEQFKVLLQQKNSEGNPLCAFYKLVTPTKLACTEEQSAVLDELNNLNLFEGVNNIITAENIALLQAIYIANAKKYVDKEISDIKEQINTINELLSTTGTSSLLLDNLQTDLESGVM